MQGVSGALTTVGTVTLVWAAVSLFSTLRIAVSNVFREDWHRSRKWTPGLAFDIRMALLLGVLFVATTILTVGSQLLDDSGIELMRRIGIEADWMLSGWRSVAHFITLFVPLLLGIGMFFQLYYFVPLPHPPRVGVLFGASVAAALWEVGKYFFTSYATGYGRYDTWLMTVESDRIGMLGDIFGLIVAFVLWAYYSGIVLMIGGTVVVVHEIRRRERAIAHAFPPDSEPILAAEGQDLSP
jgi:membrane protein